MTAERVLLASVLLLAVGLGLIFGFCHGTASFSAAYPLAGSSLQVSLTTSGIPAVAGLALTLAGLLVLLWAVIASLVAQAPGPGLTSKREGHPSS